MRPSSLCRSRARGCQCCSALPVDAFATEAGIRSDLYLRFFLASGRSIPKTSGSFLNMSRIVQSLNPLDLFSKALAGFGFFPVVPLTSKVDRIVGAHVH